MRTMLAPTVSPCGSKIGLELAYAEDVIEEAQDIGFPCRIGGDRFGITARGENGRGDLLDLGGVAAGDKDTIPLCRQHAAQRAAKPLLGAHADDDG